MIYGVFDGVYSDWDIVGYFTQLDEAEKYCAIHEGCYVLKIPSLENKEDLSKVELCYEHEIVFDRVNENFYRMRNEPDRYEYYKGSCLRPNTAKTGSDWIAIKVNTKKREDRKRCEKIAQDWLAKIMADKNGL